MLTVERAGCSRLPRVCNAEHVVRSPRCPPAGRARRRARRASTSVSQSSRNDRALGAPSGQRPIERPATPSEPVTSRIGGQAPGTTNRSIWSVRTRSAPAGSSSPPSRLPAGGQSDEVQVVVLAQPGVGDPDTAVGEGLQRSDRYPARRATERSTRRSRPPPADSVRAGQGPARPAVG